MIVLIVNGKERQYEGPTNLQDYVESLGVNVNHIAVATTAMSCAGTKCPPSRSRRATAWR